MIRTKAEIAKDFRLSETGLIQNPGKFQGEPLFTVYFWEILGDGFDGQSFVEENETVHYTFYPDYGDIVTNGFEEIRNFKKIIIWEDSQGFVHHSTEA